MKRLLFWTIIFSVIILASDISYAHNGGPGDYDRHNAYGRPGYAPSRGPGQVHGTITGALADIGSIL